MVILGVKDDDVTDKVLDLILLIAKYCILRCRCLNVKKGVKQRAAIEKHIWS